MKKKVQVSSHYRKSDDDCFLGLKGHITTDFLEKGTTMNSERYCEILNTVRHDVYSKRRGLTLKGVLFNQDNARPHTAKKTLELIGNLGWEMVPHPPYSPAPSDYHLLGPLKNHLGGTKFSDDEAAKEICHEWLKSQPRDFYAKGIFKLVYRWEKCISVHGN